MKEKKGVEEKERRLKEMNNKLASQKLFCKLELQRK